MKLSVIIPCYNAAETIPDLLEALAGQEWDKTWEAIIVDNRSSDNTVEIAGEFNEKIDNLVILNANKKQGPSFARNRGVDNARGEYIAFVDADDVVSEHWLKNIGNALMNHDFVACRMEWSKLNNITNYTRQAKIQNDGLIDFDIVKFLPYAGGGSLGIKKSIHNKVGGFDEGLKFNEDVDYAWKVQLQGHKLVFVPEAVIHIRVRDTNEKAFRQHLTWAEYNVYLYEKYKHLGMEDYTTVQSLRSLYHVLRQWRHLFSPEKKELWIIRFGQRLGRVKGMVKYKLVKHGLIDQDLRKTLFDTDYN